MNTVDRIKKLGLAAPPTNGGPAEGGAGVGTVPLGTVDVAYVGMIEGEYQAAIANARQLRELRYRALRTAYQVPAEALLTVVPGADGAPGQLQWTVAPAPPT